MSSKSFEKQNKRRRIKNGVVLGSVTVGSLVLCPPVAIIPIGIGVVKLYWMNQNNKQFNSIRKK